MIRTPRTESRGRLYLHGLPTNGRYWERVAAQWPGACPSWWPGDPAPAGDWGTVVGVDWGGVLAAQIAAEGRARRLVLMSTALGAAWWPSKVLSFPPWVGPAYRWAGGRRFLQAGGEGLAAAFPRDDALVEASIGLARGIDVGALRALRARVGVPTLCLWGEHDRFMPPMLGRRLAQQLGAEFATLPGGHMLGWTDPVGVARVVGAWERGR